MVTFVCRVFGGRGDACEEGGEDGVGLVAQVGEDGFEVAGGGEVWAVRLEVWGVEGDGLEGFLGSALAEGGF